MAYTTSPLTDNSYSAMCATFKNKFKNASIDTCNSAIFDIDETLRIRKDLPNTDPYIVKLFAERDACLDRKMELNRKSK